MSLNDPIFVYEDVATIIAEAKADYELLTGKVLFPAQAEMLLLKTLAYREMLLRVGLNDAARQNLLAYARGVMLDFLGELLSVVRLAGETDDALRSRIRLAPNQYSTAGSVGAYQFHARSADASIIDVAVLSPAPVQVRVYPLCSTGLPSAAILDAVTAKCSPRDVRPLTDQLTVLAPTQVDFAIDAQVTLLAKAQSESALTAANIRLAAHVARLQNHLGGDLIDTQIKSVICGNPQTDGIYQVLLVGFANRVLAANEWPHCTSIRITQVGVADG